jgi:hypothetical protein
MATRLTLEIDDHYHERPDVPDTLVLQLLRQATGKMDAHDALELVNWAAEQALANSLRDLYHDIMEIYRPLKLQASGFRVGSFEHGF